MKIIREIIMIEIFLISDTTPLEVKNIESTTIDILPKTKRYLNRLSVCVSLSSERNFIV